MRPEDPLTPWVSIGMPLYNAERYLAQTLESILNQTLADFELVISDNGSSDQTEQICRAYAAKDERIRYHREDVNRGAAWNHNRVFALSRGEYFKWASYDDLLGPEFLERCVAVLDQNPAVVSCCTTFMDIDDFGNPLKNKSSGASKARKSHQRLRALINKRHSCEEIYGVMRASILRKTPLIAPYVASDQNLLAELALYGEFHEVPEVLFFHRWHSKSTCQLWPSPANRSAWFDPRLAGRITAPYWRQGAEYVRSLHRVRLGWKQRMKCYRQILWWLEDCRGELYWEGRQYLIDWVKVKMPWVRITCRAMRLADRGKNHSKFQHQPKRGTKQPLRATFPQPVRGSYMRFGVPIGTRYRGDGHLPDSHSSLAGPHRKEGNSDDA
ncbi:MAG TPA: glycosyltransferase family 2 protein [Patescibacteria group bacterium]|nr:glycosyltransferase family 2 protein [Patescibacteria group bacterium]